MASSHASSPARSEGWLRRGAPLGGLLVLGLALGAAALPSWLVFLSCVALAKGLVVLGLVMLWRAGLIPFGQALYFAAGAYTVALLSRAGLKDAVLLMALGGLAASVVAFLVGFLLARYREIFFAMLSLAVSMILYGVLVKTEALGSTDGFNVAVSTFFGLAPRGNAQVLALFWLTLGTAALSALAMRAYFGSVAGALAVPLRDNEIRVEYLGVPVTRLVHLKLVIAGLLAGLGGALTALVVAHVDPEMAYWTTSGGFVFVAILAGPHSVTAAFVSAFLFEALRSFAVTVLPGLLRVVLGSEPVLWQAILGSALLLTILFIPEGIGSLARFARRRTPP